MGTGLEVACKTDDSARGGLMQTVPSVVEVAAEESLLAPPVANILNTFSVWFCGGWWLPDIQLGCRFSELVRTHITFSATVHKTS